LADYFIYQVMFPSYVYLVFIQYISVQFTFMKALFLVLLSLRCCFHKPTIFAFVFTSFTLVLTRVATVSKHLQNIFNQFKIGMCENQNLVDSVFKN